MLSTSIVIPTKNSVDTIEECISSLMPYYREGHIGEIVVVDGHSTDGTLDVVSEYPVKLLLEEGKGNIGMAYDIGWRNAQGELIIFLDSDVYLDEGFFPRAHELLSNDKVGWISCAARAVVTNRLTKTQAEEWTGVMRAPAPSRFRRLYTRIAYAMAPESLGGGPCMIVRRICLEAVDGFQGLSLGTLRCCGDVSVSQRVANRGWKTIWWMDAPVYHHPRATFSGWMKQFYGYGKSLAHMHLEREFRESYPWYHKAISIVARLASPAVAIYLAVRFRNPLHIITYPPPRYAWAIGYIVGWIGATNQKGRSLN